MKTLNNIMDVLSLCLLWLLVGAIDGLRVVLHTLSVTCHRGFDVVNARRKGEPVPPRLLQTTQLDRTTNDMEIDVIVSLPANVNSWAVHELAEQHFGELVELAERKVAEAKERQEALDALAADEQPAYENHPRNADPGSLSHDQWWDTAEEAAGRKAGADEDAEPDDDYTTEERWRAEQEALEEESLRRVSS